MMTTETMRAYHGNPALKAAVLAKMAGHRADETLIKGVYWATGRGCAVGCLTHDPVGGHAQYPVRWGIPEELAWLEDAIFEHLPLKDARAWPERFLAAIEPGADLSGVYAAWAAVLMLDPERGNVTRCVGSPEAGAAVRRVGELWRDSRPTPGSAEWSQAWAAARSAAWVAKAQSKSAESAAWSAAWSAEQPRAATESAEWSATSAGVAADPSAGVVHWCWMADQLIASIESAPVAVLGESERVGR